MPGVDQLCWNWGGTGLDEPTDATPPYTDIQSRILWKERCTDWNTQCVHIVAIKLSFQIVDSTITRLGLLFFELDLLTLSETPRI